MVTKGKEWYMSKMVWFNIVTMVAGVIAILQGMVTDPEILSALVLAQGIANVILRVWFTTMPVGTSVSKVKTEFVVK